MSTAHTPGRIGAALAAVDGLLARDGEPQAARRASVCLLRIALEGAVDDVWRDAGRPEVCTVSRRAQFLVLAQVRDATVAASAAALWGSLSCAGHHHAYELTPTAAELAGWRADTGALVAALADPGGASSRS